MIPAPFVAGCPTIIDRVGWLMFTHVFDGALPRSPLAAQGILFAPAILVTAIAAWAWYSRRPNLALGVALMAVAVHPPLLLALLPLLSNARTARTFDRADAFRLGGLIAGATALLVWLAPSCGTTGRAGTLAILGQSVLAIRAGTGIIVPVLAVFETIRNPFGAATSIGWATVACSMAATLLFPAFDARITLVPAAVALWWLAVLAGRALVADQGSLLARVGAASLFALVPLLQASSVSAANQLVVGQSRISPPTAEALDQIVLPAALVREDARYDVLIKWWRASTDARSAGLQIVEAEAPVVDRLLKTHAVYAFAGGARQFQDRGVLVAPVATPSSTVWRAISSSHCTELSPAWQDITHLSQTGQLSGLFAAGATGRHAVIYMTFPRDASINTLDWSASAIPGLRLSQFTLADSRRRVAFHRMALSDDFPITHVPPETPAVARLLLGRMEPTPGALAVTFDTTPIQVFARLDNGPFRDSLRLCGSTRDLTVIGEAQAPSVATFDLRSSAAVGAGWHGPEREGDVRFRWMQARDAELRFVAATPTPLRLELDVIDRNGDGPREPERVSLNGIEAACQRVDDVCTWPLPGDALSRGLNLLTIHSSAPLKVAGARLRSPSVSHMR